MPRRAELDFLQTVPQPLRKTRGNDDVRYGLLLGLLLPAGELDDRHQQHLLQQHELLTTCYRYQTWQLGSSVPL